MSLETEVQELTKASNEQTAASLALAQEVAGKMAEIDQKAADAIIPLGENTTSYYVDPVNGSDVNTGKSTAQALATFDKALTLASVPELEGCHIYIFLKGSYSYHIDEIYNIYNRFVSVAAWSSADMPDVYVDPQIKNSNYQYFGSHGLVLYNSSFRFHACRIYTPLFSEAENHDSVLTSSSGGIFRPITNSHKHIFFSSCELHMGDQYMLVPSPGDMETVFFSSTSFHLRPGKTSDAQPIKLNAGTVMVTNFHNCSLNDGLTWQEGSLFGGVNIVNGIATNMLTNVTIQEAAA